MTPSQQEAARLFTALRHCSPEVTKAYDLILTARTKNDFIVLMAGLYQAMHEAPGLDLSVSLDHLHEADEQIDDAPVLTYEDLVEITRERMQDERKAA